MKTMVKTLVVAALVALPFLALPNQARAEVGVGVYVGSGPYYHHYHHHHYWHHRYHHWR